jgi:Na+/H+ antiporter NhaC
LPQFNQSGWVSVALLQQRQGDLGCRSVSGSKLFNERRHEMKTLVTTTVLLLFVLLILFAPVALANSYGEEEESEGLELSLISGLILFISLLCTVIVAFLMKKGKASIKTHHTLAFITVILALFHGIYNLLAS